MHKVSCFCFNLWVIFYVGFEGFKNNGLLVDDLFISFVDDGENEIFFIFQTSLARTDYCIHMVYKPLSC